MLHKKLYKSTFYDLLEGMTCIKGDHDKNHLFYSEDYFRFGVKIY
jgi:hypothetical protein